MDRKNGCGVGWCQVDPIEKGRAGAGSGQFRACRVSKVLNPLYRALCWTSGDSASQSLMLFYQTDRPELSHRILLINLPQCKLAHKTVKTKKGLKQVGHPTLINSQTDKKVTLLDLHLKKVTFPHPQEHHQRTDQTSFTFYLKVANVNGLGWDWWV